MQYKKNKGSLTLEACIVVPVFLILMLLLNGFFVMFMGQQMVCHALIQSTKSLAYDPYASSLGEAISAEHGGDLFEMVQSLFSDYGSSSEYNSLETWNKDTYPEADLIELIENRFNAYLKTQNPTGLLKVVGVKDGSIDFSESNVDGSVLTVKLKYTQKFLFNAAGLTDFERELTLKVNLFEYKQLP